MRTDLDHLPPAKQRELEHVVEILFEEFRVANENATARRKGAQILKIILFGSYARGDWIDAPLSANQYKSDYDLLVIVNQENLPIAPLIGPRRRSGWFALTRSRRR